MNRPIHTSEFRSAPRMAARFGRNRKLRRTATCCVAAALFAASALAAQVLTVDTSGKGPVASNGPVDRQYAQIVPTHVEFPKTGMDPKTQLLLIRAMESEQGFAMRPFPRGHKGLTLAANGKLDPAGEAYLNMVISEGLSAKPGSRVVITDIKLGRSKIVLSLNGGPDAKHRFLRHIQIGVGPQMGDPDIDPEIANQAGNPTGSHLTIVFPDRVPALTPADLKALLAPLISFDVKTPIQAFTDTLPKELKDAILSHKVLVGMSTDMMLFAKGQPRAKSREMDGQIPFEEWIYGTPPEEVDFVRVNGNRVIRVEIAKEGRALQVFTQDVVSPMLLSSGSPQLAAESHTRTIHEGDYTPDTDRQAPNAPPSLRNPGETLPTDSQTTGVMRPVQPPRPHKDEQLGANPDEQPGTPPAGSQSSQPGKAQSSPSQTQTSPPASSSQPAATSNATPTAPSDSAQPN